MDFLLSLIPGGNLTILGVIGAAVLAVARWLFVAGKKSERLKQAKANEQARRTADDVQNEVDRLSEQKAKAELKEWSKR